MLLDWLRLWPEFVRLNLQKAVHARRLRARRTAGPPPPAPCQSGSDSGRAGETHCEACLRLDRSARYRHVCPAVRLGPAGAFCALDSAAIRPAWGRALLGFSLPPLLVAALCVVLAWAFLRFGTGLDHLPLADLAWPPRWKNFAEHRRAHFRDTALRALVAGDTGGASIALVSAAHTGTGSPADNQALARLAALGGYHSLADEIHAANIAAHPERSAELALAWHDDLLLSRRPLEISRLALEQLARPDAPREFWLQALFESLRHPGVAASLLAQQPAPPVPHPGLQAALAARAALDRGDRIAAADQLLALSGLLPGQAARRFLTLSWLALDDGARARAAALSRSHPAPPGEIACLVHALLRAEGQIDPAREALRPLFSAPELRPRVLAALIADPDADLLREFARALPPETRGDASLQSALWLAARLAEAPDLAQESAAALAALGRALPEQVQTLPPDRDRLRVTAGLLPYDRETLRALLAPPSN